MPDPKPGAKRAAGPQKARRTAAALGALGALPLAVQAVPAQAAVQHPESEAAPDGVINYSCGPGIYPPNTVNDYTVRIIRNPPK